MKTLLSHNVGIVCLTRENLSSPWLLFESGALSKSIRDSRVITYALDLSVTEVPFPLAQFQGVSADEEGTKKLLKSLNEIRQSTTPVDRLNRKFGHWWSDLSRIIKGIPDSVPKEGIINSNDIDMRMSMLELRMKAFEMKYTSDKQLSKPQRSDIDNLMSPSLSLDDLRAIIDVVRPQT